MNFDEYQKKASPYDLGEKTSNLKDSSFIEKVLGLVGEAAEASEKVKKVLRDKNGVMDAEDKTLLIKELGDVLWYVAMIAEYLEVPMSEVAKMNIDKLEDRSKRQKLHGAGDER